MVVVLLGGAATGGMLVLLAFPDAVRAPWPVLLGGAAVALGATLRTARRLQPRR